jgi:hypothetical protein
MEGKALASSLPTGAGGGPMRLGMDGYAVRSMDGDGRAQTDLKASACARKVSSVARQGSRQRRGCGGASSRARLHPPIPLSVCMYSGAASPVPASCTPASPALRGGSIWEKNSKLPPALRRGSIWEFFS